MTRPAPPPPPGYAEFAVQSNFSFLRAASRPEELAVTARRAGLAAMGLADRNTVAGVVRAWKAAEAAGLAYHPGCRLSFCDGTPDILAYPRDRAGWGHLCRLLTEANERGEKGAPEVDRAMLMEWGDRMALAVMPDLMAPAQETLALLRDLKDRFGENVRLAAACLHGGHDRFRLDQAAALGAAAGMKVMAVNDVLYHESARRPLQDVVTAIRLKTTLSGAGLALSVNSERHLRKPGEMAQLFAHHPDMIAQTLAFAGSLSFELDELGHLYPSEAEADPQALLEELTWQGAARRYPSGISGKVREAVEAELKLIARKKYAPYFLTVHDIVRFAREEKGILCQGRGSAANSTVCFCLGITEVDPDRSQLLFARFLSDDRDEPPDIDVDFEHERRDEVMAYIYDKYSGTRTALAAAVTTYRARSTLREVARAFGLSQDAQAALSGSIWGWSSAELGEAEAKAGGLDMKDPVTRHVIARANELIGFPRHLTQHVGGFVITQDRLDEIVPIVRTAMEERRMVEWDKDDLESVRILKVDVLALGMLSCLRRCFGLLGTHYGMDLSLAEIHRRAEEEKPVYDMICRADTLGVFQIESRAQMSMLPRLQPREFYDLVIEVAIVRPGPIQGDMVHPYLRRREGKEDIEYHSPELENILKRTKGVPLFQEQAMEIAIVAGGFTSSEADLLRRAMATFRRTGEVASYKHRMVEGMVDNGYPREFAERCFRQIEGFGEYGFPESHAASFALLVYVSSWFKAYYPDIFCAAILNSQPMGFYAPDQLVRDAREHGVELRPPDINRSQYDCTLEAAPFRPGRIAPRHAEMAATIRSAHAVRLGLRQVAGLSEADAGRLTDNRGSGYMSVRDLWLRSGLQRSALQRLAEADAFRSLGLDRRAALWAVRALDEAVPGDGMPLFERPFLDLRDNEPVTMLPPMPAGEHVIQDYRTLSLSLKAHPVSFLRGRLEEEKTIPNGRIAKMTSGLRLCVCGLVLIRQRPGSAKGVIFMTLEDETGIANVIVWKDIFARYKPLVLGARFVRVTGRLQSASGVVHVVAEHIEDLSARLQELCEKAELVDFRGPTDEVRRPIDTDRRGLSKKSDMAPVSTLMPKGRNFH